MKNNLILFLSLITIILISSSFNSVLDNPIKADDCTYKGFKLYGKIKIVDSYPDIKVQIVNSFPDIKVKLVDHYPDQCGKWQIVEHFPDVKIQFVEHFPDIKVQFVESFPGVK